MTLYIYIFEILYFIGNAASLVIDPSDFLTGYFHEYIFMFYSDFMDIVSK